MSNDANHIAAFAQALCVPLPPLLTSHTTQWQTIVMGYMHQPAYAFPEVCLPWHGIGIFTNAAPTERTINGTTKNDSFNPGDIVVVPAKIGHGVRWTDTVEMLLVGLAPSLFHEAIYDANCRHQTALVPHFATHDPLVYQLGLRLKAVLEQDLPGSRLYAETTATMLAVHLLQQYGQRKLEFKAYTDGLPQSVLCQVTDYIHAHLDQALGLADLATIANLSPHYFTRLFKQATGFTPHQFVLRCRVERAKTLLLNSKSSLAEVAQQVGFANQAHLHVHIKRSLGVTPKMIFNQRKNR